MVPRVGRQGRSFKGAAAYYLHDVGASTSKRVAFTHTENLPTDDPERAFDWMAYTAMDAENIKREAGVKRTGGPAEKTVFTLSLSWHPEQEPTQEHQIDTANSALAMLGLKNHQAVMVGHNDEAHPHIHVIVNLIDPETGRSMQLPFTKEKMSKWAEAYEREHGKIYCENRIQNNAKRKKAKEQDNEEFPRYKDPEVDHKSLVSRLYHAADSGKAFQAALAEHGYKLAQGKRIVIIDEAGRAHNIARWIDNAKEKDVRAKLSDITLLRVDEIGSQQQSGRAEEQETQGGIADQKNGPEPSDKDPAPQKASPEIAREEIYFDRDEQDRQWQESIIDAGIAADQEKPPRPRSIEAKPEAPETNLLNRIQDRQLAELGSFYNEITDARFKLHAEIESTYGADERRLRQEIKEREDKLKSAGRLRLAFMYLTGRYARTQREIAERTLSLKNIEWRKQERTSAVETQIEEKRQLMAARHQQERQPGQTQKESPRMQPAHIPAPAKDFKNAHDRKPDSGYEARRAAFMGTALSRREHETVETPVSRAATPQPADADTSTLAQEFENAAGYESRRAAFMGTSPTESFQEAAQQHQRNIQQAELQQAAQELAAAMKGVDQAFGEAASGTSTAQPSAGMEFDSSPGDM